MRLRPYVGSLSMVFLARLVTAQGMCGLMPGHTHMETGASSHCGGMQHATQHADPGSRHSSSSPAHSHDGPVPLSCCAALASCTPVLSGALVLPVAEIEGPKATLPVVIPGRLLSRATAPEPPPPKQIGR